MTEHQNPLIWADFPDLDVIRVEDTYYMVSTTMHMMPGCVILRSYDLVNWEIATYVYETLDSTPGQKLEDNQGIYGQGMWAASIRYHEGVFYICFVANDTGKTYLYTSKKIEGPWKKHQVEGFYHDCSLLFDDEKVYIVYGNRDIHLVRLKKDLSGPMAHGLNRIIVRDEDHYMLGFEGCHLYKINQKYYLFMIHWPKDGNRRRQQACYMADSLEGEFRGGNILDDDLGYHNKGVAQGGIVDTPEGDWYSMLFQDHDAVGRIPVLVPMHFEQDMPVLGVHGKVPTHINIQSTRENYEYAPLFVNDDFDYREDTEGHVTLAAPWQWNHEPDWSGISFSEKPGCMRLRTVRISPNVILAKNTLTQRTAGPVCEGIITMDGSGMKDGDYAGISAFQSSYAMIALTREQGQYYLVMLGRSQEEESGWGKTDIAKPGAEYARVAVDSPQAELKVRCDFTDSVDLAGCYYKRGGRWIRLGEQISMEYSLEHFMGYRFAISCFATKETGGYADFESFRYVINPE